MNNNTPLKNINYKSKLIAFFLKPASPKPLAVLRIGLCLVLLCQFFMMKPSVLDFFSSSGFVQRPVAKELADSDVPKLDWMISFFDFIHLTTLKEPTPGTSCAVSRPPCKISAEENPIAESTVIYSFGILYLVSLIFLLTGVFTRSSAFFVWLIHWMFMNTGYSGAYGADMYAHFLLFYLIWLPSGALYSIDSYSTKTYCGPSWQARLGLRVIQIHMGISYLTSGIEKSTGPQWWNGEIIYKALNHPSYATFDMHWLVEFPLIPIILGWSTLLIEGGYIFFIWSKSTRNLWVLATCGLHLGIAIFLKLPIFGLLMCVPTLALFGVSAEKKLFFTRTGNRNYFNGK